MKKVDYIIVGQGLAGSFLSWFLLKNEKTFVVVDEINRSSASSVAAGIIHPVTGRRIVKTWMADELLPFAQKTYQEIEVFFSMKLFHPLAVIELLSSPREYNDWMARSGEPELLSYIDNTDNRNCYSDYLQPFYRTVTINKSSWINMGAFLTAFRNYFLINNMLVDEKFEYDNLRLTAGGVEYKDYEALNIIFCEGVESVGNPYWAHLPFVPSKGEVLTIRAEMELNHILNKKIFILPLGMNLFRVGSTYSWNAENNFPTEEGKDFLVAQLKTILKIPFDIVDHRAAIRPTVRDRRPFLGLHPAHDRVGIFNGLGTKGCLLAPYFANHLTGFLLGKNKLLNEVDVRKWKADG